MHKNQPSQRQPQPPQVPPPLPPEANDAVTAELAHVSRCCSSNMKPLEAIRCTQPTCTCECFAPGKKSLRYCDTCSHGWVSHALDKLGTSHVMNLGLQVEVVQPNIVFDIASLMLYGAHATPVRLKILLDRLFSVLQHEEVLQVLHGFGWTYEDYARGYILQDSSGRVLDKWCVATREEEMVVLQQFLRFGETKAIAQEIILQDTKDRHDVMVKQSTRAESDIKKFIERSNLTMQNYIKSYESTRQLFGPRSVPVPFIPPPGQVQVPRMMTPPLVSPGAYVTASPPTARADSVHATPSSSRPQVPAVSTPTMQTITPPASGSHQVQQLTQQPFDATVKDHQAPTPAAAAAAALNLSQGMILPKAVAAAAVAAAQQRSPATHLAAENAAKNLSVKLPVVMPQSGTTTPTSAQQLLQQQTQAQVQIQKLQILQQQQLQEQLQKQAQQQQQNQSDLPLKKIQTQPQLHHKNEQDLDEVDGGCDGFGSCSEDEGEVLDFSTKEDGESDGEKSNGKQHNRKSSNPTKRHWTPSANFGSTLVGPNGKKRVLCTACNKTFCDKGALKIHYSAVHLKEMHKCTVEGCNMMFSSRRSRNRHSANPNPKLHVPQKPRKDDGDLKSELDLSTASNNSDDGRSVTPIATSTPTPSLSVPTSSTPLTVSTTPTGLPILEAPRLIRPDTSFFLEMSSQFPFMSPPPVKRVKLEEEDKPTDLSKSQASPAAVVPVVTLEEGPCDLSSKKSGSEERKLEIDLDAPMEIDTGVKDKEKVEPFVANIAATAPAVIATVAAIAEETASKTEGMRAANRRKNNAPTRCTKSNDSLSTSEEMIDEKLVSCGARMSESDDGDNAMNQKQPASNKESGENHIGGQDDPESDVAETEVKVFPKITSILCSREDIGGADTGVGAIKPEGAESVIESHCIKNTAASPEQRSIIGNNSAEEVVEEDEDESDSESENESLPSSEGVLSGMQEYPSEVYVDKDSPLTCKICGKVFQNSFTVKVHFQNVHLKLMHACTVSGCTATFPSKRSRDRHSANLNLHRKQLSGEGRVQDEMDETMKGNILAKLYGVDYTANCDAVAAAKSNGGGSVSTENNLATVTLTEKGNNNNNNTSTTNNNNSEECEKSTGSNAISLPSASPSPLKLTIQHSGLNGHASKAGSAGSEAVSEDSEEGGDEGEREQRETGKDEDSSTIVCRVCSATFTNLLVLREHFGLAHPNHVDLDLETEAVANRRSLSPRRARNRQKVEKVVSRSCGVATRKTSTSL